MTIKPIAFVDPGPSLAQYLAAVGRQLAPEYGALFFARRIKSRSILRRLGQEVHSERQAARRMREPAGGIGIDRDLLISRLRKTSDQALVAGSDRSFRSLALALDTFLDRTGPAAVFFWNGSGLAAAITEQLARTRGIPRLYAENGYLPGTLQLDPEGVNAFSSIGRDLGLERIRALHYSEEERRAFDRLLDDYRAGRPPRREPPPGGRRRPSPLAYLLQAWQDWRERDPSIRANRLIPRRPDRLPGRFVFFPLQVRADSQLTIHSPLYGNRLDTAIADLDAALRDLDPGLRLVVKLHPADLGKTDYDPLVRAFPQITWLGGGDVRAVLQEAACVVTVNSTVGIEAMIFGKPVVTLGDNFYTHAGLVHPVRDRAELRERLAAALSRPPDLELTDQFLRYLYFHAFVRAHWRDYSRESLENLAGRIKRLIAEPDAALGPA